MHAEVQQVDLGFQPDPAARAARARLGWLGRMTERPCLLEAFHQAPSADELRSGLSKQLAMHQRALRARDREPPAPSAPAEGGVGPADARSPLEPPYLWIVAGGRPDKVIRAFKFHRRRGWPPGFYEAAPGLMLGLVVLRELPETRDTLLLRLMGAGAVLRRALAELRALDRESWEWRVASPLVLAVRLEIPYPPNREEEEFMMDAQQIYQEVLREGREEGREEGLKETLLEIYAYRFGSVPEPVRSAIVSCTAVSRLRAWLPAFLSQEPSGIAEMVSGPSTR